MSLDYDFTTFYIKAWLHSINTELVSSPVSICLLLFQSGYKVHTDKNAREIAGIFISLSHTDGHTHTHTNNTETKYNKNIIQPDVSDGQVWIPKPCIVKFLSSFSSSEKVFIILRCGLPQSWPLSQSQTVLLIHSGADGQLLWSHHQSKQNERLLIYLFPFLLFASWTCVNESDKNNLIKWIDKDKTQVLSMCDASCLVGNFYQPFNNPLRW